MITVVGAGSTPQLLDRHSGVARDAVLRDWPAQLVPAASLNGRLQQEKLVMGKDRIARTAKEAKGSVNEAAGKVVGDAKLQSDGKAERTAARSRMPSQHEGHRAEDRQEVNRTVFLNEQPG